MKAQDQMPESLRTTESIERRKERVQKPEDVSKTDKIEKEKKKS
jgi:hypothetical protein